ncbi:MAG: hypothetical protein J6M30_04765 [Bacteroidales bacterium]|nr:hypothetical protein [Bacteroidales bacterium]
MKENKDNALDQFFTDRKVAEKLVKTAKSVISSYEKSIDDFVWIEPSAGDGVFYDLFPKDKRIGIDILPLRNEFIKSDYLQYRLPDGKLIVMGNPPFGHRGVTALEFINHSDKAEYVCFILPMFFESQGKGSIKYRVKGFNLIHSEMLQGNVFYSYTAKRFTNIKCVFQIWSKNHKLENTEYSWYNNNSKEPFSDVVKVVTVSLAKKRECGKEWIFNKKADFYISSTFYGDISVVDSFDKVKYKSGIAIILQTDDENIRRKIGDILINAKWKDYATSATNSCYHLGKSNIFRLLKDNL